jgi:hypothetical protein
VFIISVNITKEHTAFITGWHLTVVVCHDAWHINSLDIVTCWRQCFLLGLPQGDMARTPGRLSEVK